MKSKKELFTGIALILIIFSIFFIDNKIESLWVEPQVKEVQEIRDVPVPLVTDTSPTNKYKENKTPLKDNEFLVLVQTCNENNIEPTLALGLIQVESSFKPNSKNSSGCYGYCQLNPKYFGKALSPEQNIREGIEYLAYQFNRYDNLESGLTAYNAGHDTKDMSYARAVLKAADYWEEVYGG